MALQMQHAPATDIIQFGRFDAPERGPPREESLDIVEAGGVPNMDWNALLPIAAIGFKRIRRSHILAHRLPHHSAPADHARPPSSTVTPAVPAFIYRSGSLGWAAKQNM